jgi:hypothetical protein
LLSSLPFVIFFFDFFFIHTLTPQPTNLVLCGRWETYPREFAKCRRCRKAKYCGKECQSTAWSEGHRFWCSAKDVDEDGGGAERDRGGVEHPPPQPHGGGHPPLPHGGHPQPPPHGGGGGIQVAQFGAGDVVNVPVGREVRRERERPTRDRGGDDGYRASATVSRAEGSMARDRTVQQLQLQPSRIRSRQGQGQQVPAAPDPTNAAYLTFQVQGQESSGTGNGRRRAETIMGVGGGLRVDGHGQRLVDGHGHGQRLVDGHGQRLVDGQIPPNAPAPPRMIPRHPLHHQPQGPLVPQEWFSPPNTRRNEPGPSRRTNQPRRMDVSPTTTTTSLSYRGSSASGGMGGDDNDMVLG